MTRLEKIELAISKGIDYNHLTGEVTGVKGNVLTKKCNGYIVITLWFNGKRSYLYAHQFGYFLMYRKLPDCIDHINGIKTDNRLSNLREVTKQVNALNTKARGVYFDKSGSKWVSKIEIDGKSIILGRFKEYDSAKSRYNNYKRDLINNKINLI